MKKILILMILGVFVIAACTQQLKTDDMPMRAMGGMDDMDAMNDMEKEMNEEMEESSHDNPRGLDGMNGMNNMMGGTDAGFLPTDDGTVPLVRPTETVSLEDGDSFDLEAGLVKKIINGKEVIMYGYNGMIPGPIIKAAKGATITVNFKNNIEYDSTVHWHGLRHDVKDDGVPDVTQPPVKTGEVYSYEVFFPDEGVYWYHPHVREDLQQDLGLAGNMFAMPEEGYFNNVNHEEFLVLDDILMNDEGLVPFGKEEATHALMGRFGNVMLVNGETDYQLDIHSGEVMRFFVTNVANARPFNVSFEGAQIKLVGSDLGAYERETFVDSVIIAPAERYILEVFFPDEREYRIRNINPENAYTLGTVVATGPPPKDFTAEFQVLRSNNAIIEDIDQFRQYFDKEIDRTLELTLDMPMMDMMGDMNMGSGMDSDEEHEGIEWEDSMPQMNAMMDSGMITWIIRDTETGAENMDLSFSSEVGDVLKIRLFNTEESAHPMQHPIHLHGQRFLVVDVDGVRQENLAWKDTVLVPTGSTIDILVDVTNPGEWMMHCHIAEHLTAGMMSSFTVNE